MSERLPGNEGKKEKTKAGKKKKKNGRSQAVIVSPLSQPK
jgi:hypothetical protein